jgi:hypothetical protein
MFLMEFTNTSLNEYLKSRSTIQSNVQEEKNVSP